jgi:hypothetical protein
MTQWLRYALGGLLALTSACGIASQRVEKLAPSDPDVLETNVQPYLERACATLDCHGVAGRPLRLYSELGLRADTKLRPTPISNTQDPLPLTGAELAANRLAFAGVALGSQPDQQLALRKPLAAAIGGIHHVGGVHWKSKTDPGYLCLRGWLIADISEDVATMCARATAALQP